MRNWRAGWIGRLLRIHSPSAHAAETCWCIGTKHELVIPNFMTKSQALGDMEAYYRYISEIADKDK